MHLNRLLFYAPNAPGGGTDPGPSPVDGGSSVPSGSGSAGGEPASGAEPDPWNGELESLAKEPWWAQVPEDVRPHVEQGLKTKHGKWQSGFQTRFEGFNKDKLSLEERATRAEKDLEKTRTDREWVNKLLGEDDKLSTLSTELEGLKATLSTKDAELETVRTEKTAAEAKLQDIQTKLALRDLEARFPDIYKDFKEGDDKTPSSGAFVDFMKLVNAGVDEAEAATFVRAKMKPAAPVLEDPPHGVMASTRPGPKPGAFTKTQGYVDFDEVMAQKRAEAQAEDE